MANPIDFDDKDGLRVFQAAWDASDEYQKPRDEQYTRDYQNFHAFLDMSLRNPDRSNVTIPKVRSIIMTKGPREVKAAIGRRPYIPFDTLRTEFSPLCQLSVKMLDTMLYRSGFFNEFVLCDLMKITFGTSFMECIPYFKTEWRKIANPIVEEGPNGEPLIKGIPTQMVPVLSLRFALRSFGPWEVRVDPFASGLENETQCRYIIKVGITSKRLIKKMALGGAYPGLDVELLDSRQSSYGFDTAKSRGLQMLASMGLPNPREDKDIAVIFRYESPERYIDVMNDTVTLRDVENPYRCSEGGHGLINLSRMIHDVDPHTQARFWGDGEAKANEILQALQNDLWNMALDNHNFGNHGMTYYAVGRGVTPEKLVRAVGNKVPFQLGPNERIQDVVLDVFGQPLPPDHYRLLEMNERYMNVTARKHETGYGEATKGDHTLGEVQMLKEAGDEADELNVKNIENPFLTDFGHKCLCHLDQFSRFEDKKAILGERDAMRLVLMNPRDLPGGYDFTFTGSDRIVNLLIKQRNILNLDKRLSASPYLKEREWLTELLDSHEMGNMTEKVLKSEEEVMQDELMALQTQAVTSEMGGEPNPGKVATRSAQEAYRP